MSYRSIVTGANGHLGNNILRCLRNRNELVSGAVRRPEQTAQITSLGGKGVLADLLDKPSLLAAFKDQDIVYHAGAVFKHWSRNKERDIYEANMNATRNVLEAAAETGVQRIVYVSSLAATDRNRVRIDETGWNPDRSNVYFRSKTDSEKLAWELAGQLDLDMVSVLPGAMIGGHFNALTPTLSLFRVILNKELNVNPGFYLNFVDVVDVAEACLSAAHQGQPGERYLLANEHCTGVDEIIEMAQTLFPERGIKTPTTPPRALLYLIAGVMEFGGRLLNKEPLLQRNFLDNFSVKERCDISKARRALGYNPRPPMQAVRAALEQFDAIY